MFDMVLILIHILCRPMISGFTAIQLFISDDYSLPSSLCLEVCVET